MLNWCLTNIRYTVLCLNIFSKKRKGVLTTTKRWIFFSQSQLLIQVLFNITVRVPREISKLQWIAL
uniref:Uncharacterized protein n=1 Tax=Aotus nancymaae TaxID=37293 RepID=A0A2K5C1U5_AOTNA